MHPQLDFLLFKISAYSFFTIAAFIIVIIGSYLFSLKRGFTKSQSLAMLLGMGIASFVGARIFNVIINFESYRNNIQNIFSFEFEGFSLYGGIIFALLSGFFIARKFGINLLKFADTTIPFVGIGIATMRIGCFLNGCCFGKETNLPWGVKFPYLSPAHIHQINENILSSTSVSSVHPTQIYELIAALIGTLIVFVFIKKDKPNGTAFLAFAIWFSTFRLINMQFRILPYNDIITNYSYPTFYVAIIAFCIYYLAKINSFISDISQEQNQSGPEHLNL